MVDEMPVTTVSEDLENEGAVVYEIGFHLLPTISEDDVAARFGDVRAAIEELKGSIISEGFPVLIQLAYTIVAKGGKFDRAYFGWIKFDLAASQVAALKEACDHNGSIIRYLIVKTTRESDVEFKKPLMRIGAESTTAAVAGVVGEEVKAPVSEEELDKSLEGMIAE